ncbi:Uridylate kinase [bacterium HR17]|uniref:Uridylate kinase n=1 Tax=Candidatus Fervidibacter japonicus TaxID=2035412 RepID=A0A2H5XB78_9BACT|nr:Uridylate kinase [bacterium HR17]
MSGQPRWRRIVLKMSGEVLGGTSGFGLDDTVVNRIADEIRAVHALGVDIGIVVGGGNFFRGVEAAVMRGMDRVAADYIGMLATVINALALQEALERCGLETRVMSAFEIRAVCEPFIQRRAVRHLEKGRIVIFAAGTGHPFFSTDTAAVLRAAQIKAEVILKGTDVDGVYDRDPHQDPAAVRFERISFAKALELNLRVMDATAFSLSWERNIPIVVFNITVPGNLVRTVCGEPIGTIVM